MFADSFLQCKKDLDPKEGMKLLGLEDGRIPSMLAPKQAVETTNFEVNSANELDFPVNAKQPSA
jgi:hypothetical protein